jgi:hypothetical protein
MVGLPAPFLKLYRDTQDGKLSRRGLSPFLGARDRFLQAAIAFLRSEQPSPSAISPLFLFLAIHGSVLRRCIDG